MHEVRVLVTLQVDTNDPETAVSRESAEDAAVEAVEKALKAADSAGFSRAHAENLSVGFVDAVAYEEEAEDTVGPGDG